MYPLSLRLTDSNSVDIVLLLLLGCPNSTYRCVKCARAKCQFGASAMAGVQHFIVMFFVFLPAAYPYSR